MPAGPVPVDAGEVAVGPDSRWLVAGAWLLALVTLFGMLSVSGIWDPYELRVAELARRIAVAMFRAQKLAFDGDVNSIPTLGELAKGEIPFTSVAAGFKVFGLSEWAGRLPLALWGLGGIAATYALVARLVDRRAAAFSVFVLATMPLYFLQARTILGDIVTMSAHAMATAGLSLALFDDRAQNRRYAWLAVGVVGALAAAAARGALMGAAVPLLGVGLAWLVARSMRPGGESRPLGAVVLLLGIAAASLGIQALLSATQDHISRVLGSAIDRPRKLPTHDSVIEQLGHGLFPWSAVAPFALGRMFSAPPVADDALANREAALRITAVVVAAIGVGVYGAMAPSIGIVAFGPVFAVAIIVALAFRDFERGAPLSRTMAIGVAALAILFYSDFKEFPEKVLAPFAVQGAAFPESFKKTGVLFVQLATVACAGLVFIAFAERPSADEKPFDRRFYATWWVKLRTAFAGNLLFGLIVAEVSLIAVPILMYLSDHQFHWKAFDTMGAPVRAAAQHGYVLGPLIVIAPWAATAARDAARIFFRRVRISRSVFAMLSVTAVGAAMSFWYYPALAAQISPKKVFEAYRSFAQKDEELALVGSATSSASYYAGSDVRTIPSVNEAFGWLTESGTKRRWLVVKSRDFAQLNASYRGKFGKNVPVLDGRSSEVLLVSSELRPNETNQNPLAKWVVDRTPTPTHRVDANFGGQLDLVGWDVTTLDGQPVRAVRASKKYLFQIAYHVIKPITGEWQTFIHIDGYQRRFNGDHDTLEGKYPFHFWKPGDFIVDIYEFELEPNFTPGTYDVYFGLFRGDRRFEVKRGPAQDDRVHGGPLRVE